MRRRRELEDFEYKRQCDNGKSNERIQTLEMEIFRSNERIQALEMVSSNERIQALEMEMWHSMMWSPMMKHRIETLESKVQWKICSNNGYDEWYGNLQDGNGNHRICSNNGYDE